MKLPLVISVPHAGLRVPPEAEPYCILTPEQVAADGDVGSRSIYALEGEAESFHTTEIARAIVDLNRAEDERWKDGVVKTHTCWDEPVYDPTPPEEVFEALLEHYYRPYHQRLREAAAMGLPLAIDCHTMAAVGPPVAPDTGQERPWVCLSNGDGTCPREWIETLAESFQETFEGPVRINQPFRGGYITRSHAAEMPWLQLELSRGDFLSEEQKRERLLAALAGAAAILRF